MGCGYGAQIILKMHKRLFDLNIIPRIEIPTQNSSSSQEMRSVKPKYDYTLIDMETSLLSVAAGFKQSCGVCYFLEYDSGCGTKTFVR